MGSGTLGVRVRASAAEAPGYYEVGADGGALERLLGGEGVVARLCRKRGVTPREALRQYAPQAYLDPGAGAVSMSAGYDPAHDEGRLEAMVWAEVEGAVRAALGAGPAA